MVLLLIIATIITIINKKIHLSKILGSIKKPCAKILHTNAIILIIRTIIRTITMMMILILLNPVKDALPGSFNILCMKIIKCMNNA